jgi:hypothetical protein
VNTPPDQLVLEQLAPLCGPLHSALTKGAELAAEARKITGLTHPDRDYIESHLVRSIAHEELLARREELGGWIPGRREPNNGSLKLHTRSATIRVFHSPGSGRFPAPGRNVSRQRFYRQPPLAGLGVEDMLPGLAESKYIATWEVLDRATFEVGVQIFRPIGHFKYGSACKADLAFWLPNTEDELAKLSFTPTDDDIDLEIPGEAEDGGDALRG